MSFDPYNPLGFEDIESYFKLEWKYMPDGGHCSSRHNKRMREEALDVIIETIRKGGEVDAFVPYLAMNYVDCYLSRNGLLGKRDKVVKDTEMLAVYCLSLAYKTTLSVDLKSLELNSFNKSRSLEEKIHHYLLKRPNNVKYFQNREVYEAEKQIENGLMGGKKSITALCFIDHFLYECKPRHEASGDKESITQIILETQADVRFCAYKPSIISASAVTTFLSHQAPQHSQTYEEKITRLRCLDMNCLALVEETCAKNAKRKLDADYGISTQQMKKLSLKGEGKGFHVTMDYQLQWMTAAEIEELHDKYFDPYDPSGHADIEDYMNKEQEFMAQGGYSQNPNNKRLRQVGLHVISESFRIGGKVDVFVPYLAINYFDCFLSKRGLLKHKDTIMEDMELMAVSCLSLAFETTLSSDFWGESKSSEKIRDYMTERSRNLRYLFSSEDSYGGGCLVNYIFDTPEKPITSLCFINYFLNECKPRSEVAEEKETITQIILETQADIRFCAFKPSTISASAVIVFLYSQAPQYSLVYEERIMRLSCIDKDQFKYCLALVKETCFKKKLGAYFRTNKLSLQGGGKGFHVTIDYEPQWMTASEIMYLHEMHFDPYDPRGFEDIERYLANEWKHIPDDGYSTNLNNERMRQVALNAIIKSVRMGGKVDAFVPYLAMNYYDRYMSRRGILNKKTTMMEEIELLAICCLSLAFETTLSYGYPRRGDNSHEQTRQFLSKRPINVNYLDRSAEAEIGRSILLKEPITALCFIQYFLSECTPRRDVPEEKAIITRIILETQDDIRFCAFKPSIISASAVAALLSYQAPEHSHTYEEKILHRVGYLYKNELKDCLALVKEKCDKKKLGADIEMKRLSVQDGGYGFHVTIDYQLQWIITDGIEEILKSLGSGTRVSSQLAKIDGEMRSQAEQIQIFLTEIQNPENADVEYTAEKLSGMLTELGRLSLRMEEVIIKMMNYVETPQ